MKKACLVGAVLGLVLGVAADAGMISLTVEAKDFNELGSLQPIAGWDAMTTLLEDVHYKLRGEITSQPFWDSDTGDYYYLYQLENTGHNVTWHVVEFITLSPFTGADGSTAVGYLTANQPAAFDAGTEIPDGASVNTDAGPTISFGFPGYVDPISPGEITKVFYVKGELDPSVILGNIIDGGTAQGFVIGPVPEPATMCLLGLGSFALLRRKRK